MKYSLQRIEHFFSRLTSDNQQGYVNNHFFSALETGSRGLGSIHGGPIVLTYLELLREA